MKTFMAFFTAVVGRKQSSSVRTIPHGHEQDLHGPRGGVVGGDRLPEYGHMRSDLRLVSEKARRLKMKMGSVAPAASMMITLNETVALRKNCCM